MGLEGNWGKGKMQATSTGRLNSGHWMNPLYSYLNIQYRAIKILET
jgi:hypothetical protein